MHYAHVWHDSFTCVVCAARVHQAIYVTWLTYMCDIAHPYVWHSSLICVTWLIHTCDMAHSYVWHGSFLRDMTHLYLWHASFVRVTWLIHVCDMTHSCVTWLIYICDTPPSYVWHDTFIRVTLHIHKRDMTCDVTHSYTWHDSLIWWPWLHHIHTWFMTQSYSYVISLIHTCDMTHSRVTWLIHVWRDSSLQHTATPTATHCNTYPRMTWLIITTHCNINCNTLQHLSTYDVTHSHVCHASDAKEPATRWAH